MTNFVRALRLALQYRYTFGFSVFCALMVAVLWGGNIGAVYPFVEVVFEKKSMHDWVGEHIVEHEQKLSVLHDYQAALHAGKQPVPVRGSAVPDSVDEADGDVADLQATIDRYVWARDHIVRPYMPDDPFQTLVLVVGMLLVGTTLKSLFLVCHQILVGRLSQLATFNLRKLFYRRTLRMELASFGSDGGSQLMSRFTYDMESVAAAMSDLFGKMVREPLKMLACLVGAGLICWQLLIFSLVLAPLAAFTIRRLAKMLKNANRRAMEEMSVIYSILEETFQGVKVVKAFTMEPYERRRFHTNSKNFYVKSMRIARYDALTRPTTEIMGISTICVALLAGAYLVLNQETHLFGIRMCSDPPSTAALLMFYGFLAGVSDPARKLSEVFSRIQRGAAACDRIYQFMDREPTIVDPPRPTPLPRHHRGLSFENVGFHYRANQSVLEGINLDIKWGETIAIVGPNGCGKSTMANLIPRFFDPISGRVTVDGIDLRDVRLRELRSQIGLVNQETLLFDDTVFNNIRYGSTDATESQVIEAAKQAHAHRFIEDRLESGYQTVVGPRGSLLSGGQRQRIALARAILRDPAILILDEATSQVDLESEQLIQKVLEQFIRPRTTILITHRMATLALADRIVAMQNGRILDVGTHQELLRRCDLYARLYDIQLREIA